MARHPDSTSSHEPEQPARSRRQVLLLLVRNSPWVSMAALLHVLVFAILSVLYLAREKGAERQRNLEVRVAATRLELPPALDEPPPILVRDQIPLLPAKETVLVPPQDVYIPEAAPGRSGEITDEVDTSREAGFYNPDPEALSTLPSGASSGTPIGVGSVGHAGSGTPSPFSTRGLGANGKGEGGPGGNGAGGPPTMRAATHSALLWLEKHQSPDGRWSAAGFVEQCTKNECSGTGNALHDVGLTGLALLCFLGAGETHQTPLFGETVKRGLRYLLDLQVNDDEGCFGERIGQHWAYDHACATLAMAEAYGMTQAKVFKESAQRGVAFILRAQNPYGGWRYAYPPDGDNDSSVTGWMVMALKSAKLSRLTIDEMALANAVGFIDEVTDPATGRTGYTALGELPARIPTLARSFPPERSESLTAVGVLVRIFGGHTPENDPLIGRGADLLVKRLPEWDPTNGSIDFYYWYYATLALHQIGGPRWEKWNAALEGALVAHQRNEEREDEYGSWDPVDPWGPEGGRVYATALNCLTTEVYYRYPKVFGK